MPDVRSQSDSEASPVEPEPDATSAPSEQASETADHSALDAELDVARKGVCEAVTAWLVNAWEQPIVRAIRTNPARSIEHADNFRDLRAALSDLQANARQTVDDAIGPLLDPDRQTRDKALVISIDAVQLQLVGLIGEPLAEAGFDPTKGGLERVQDGYRLKTMTEHQDVVAAMQEYARVHAAVIAERAERQERERERARDEVERLWHATADAT